MKLACEAFGPGGYLCSLEKGHSGDHEALMTFSLDDARLEEWDAAAKSAFTLTYCKWGRIGTPEQNFMCYRQCDECKAMQKPSAEPPLSDYEHGVSDAMKAISALMPVRAIPLTGRHRADELLRLITANNNKVSDECARWQCSERDDGRRCPNCPMEYFIKL